MKRMIFLAVATVSVLLMQSGCHNNVNPQQADPVVQDLVIDNFEDSNLTNLINPPSNQWTYDLSYGSSMQNFGITGSPDPAKGSYSFGMTATAKATQYIGGNFIGYVQVLTNTIQAGGKGLDASIDKGYHNLKFSAMCNYTHLTYSADMVYFVRIYDSTGTMDMEYSALDLTAAWQDFSIPLNNFAMLSTGTQQDIAKDIGQIVFTLRIEGQNGARNSVHFYLDNVAFSQ